MSNQNNIKILINMFEEEYDNLNLNLFKNAKDTDTILKFGYICPGAVKTIEYLNLNTVSSKDRDSYRNIKKYTEALFFVELIVLYSDYIRKSFVNRMNDILQGNGCIIAREITKLISKEFENLSKNILTQIPDNFYHLRHQTLICSNDKQMVQDRIEFLEKIYEKFTNISTCDGKRDGVSGCRTCCNKNFKKKSEYNKCVNSCMNYKKK